MSERIHQWGNPFRTKYVFRNAREEQGKVARRLAFTKEQEEALRTVLSDSTHVVLNKQEIRVAYYLGMFTGQRMKDCVLLQWQNVDMNQGGKIWVKQFKTGKEVTIPIAPPLYQVLQEALTWKENQYVCPNLARRYNRTDKRGKNIGNNLVNKDMLRPIYWIGLDAAVPVEGLARIIYERAHGPIDGRKMVVFRDGNRYNFDIDNLVCMTPREFALNRQEKDTLYHAQCLAALTLGRLRTQINETLDPELKKKRMDKVWKSRRQKAGVAA